MRKVFNVLAVLFIVVGIVCAILPMGTLALFPVGLAVIFAGLAFIVSEETQKKFPKILLIVSTLLLVIVMVKAYAIPDEVAEDATVEQQKTTATDQDLKDLEELDVLD